MPTIPNTQLLDAARRAVAAASTVCRGLQASLDLSAPMVKGDRSPVTVADFCSQAVIARTLVAALGPIRLIAEESSAILRDPAHGAHLEAALAALRPIWPGITEVSLLDTIDLGAPPADAHSAMPSSFWTLDPIDGTKGFLRRRQYSVCLAFIDRAIPTVGALGCPNLPSDRAAPLTSIDARGCLYLATSDPAGAQELPADSPGGTAVLLPSHQRTAPSPPHTVTICSSVEPSHSSLDRLTRVLDALALPYRLVRLDSQCKYALVARGQADALVRLPRRRDTGYHIWDHAPGACVAAAAGCTVSDALGRPLDFAAGTSLFNNLGVVCAAPWLHPLLIDAVARAGVLPA